MTTKSLIVTLLLCMVFSAAAAPNPAEAPTAAGDLLNDPYTGWFKSFKNCRARYAEMDARIDAAGVRDGSYYRVPGFPYFRTDRVLASFANEVHGLEDLGGWMRRMREFDQEAREFEYLNLGMSLRERAQWRFELLGCGRALAGIELEKPAALAQLRGVVTPPAEYTDPAGKADPTAASACVVRHQAAVMQGFAGELGPAPSGTTLHLWRVKPVEDLALGRTGYAKAFMDELGFPGLVDSQWRALAEIHAPALWIETANERDQPGTPMWADGRPAVDASRPAMNYQISFTRFGSARLVQINYFYWFKGRAGDDPKGGLIDGAIWRVTLDNQAQPLVYESLHASGRDHLWFPARFLKRRSAADNGNTLIPQAAVPAGPLALRLQAGSHALRRVVALDQAAVEKSESFELQRYENLFTLPNLNGDSHSLFGPDGLIPGIQQTDLSCLWSARVNKPGALRVLGRLPISYSGLSHFDDVNLLDGIFLPSAGLLMPPVDIPPA